MDATYQIIADPAMSTVQIVMAGFFAEGDVEAFCHHYMAALDQLRCGPNQHLTLVDMQGTKIQTREIVAAFSKFMNEPTVRSRKLAFVTASTLSRIQAQRLVERDSVRFFQDRTCAGAWLYETEPVSSLRTHRSI